MFFYNLFNVLAPTTAGKQSKNLLRVGGGSPRKNKNRNQNINVEKKQQDKDYESGMSFVSVS